MSVLKIATPATKTPTEASHQATALPGSRAARRRHATSTATTAQPSTTMLVYLLNVAASSATNPASPTHVLRPARAAPPTGRPLPRRAQRGFGKGRHVITPGEQDCRTG